VKQGVPHKKIAVPKPHAAPTAPKGLADHIANQLRQRNANHRWTRNPVGWAEQQLKTFLWSKQREILNSVVRHPRTTVRSAHDTGKSFTAATATAWWLSVHPIGSAFVVTTAPTAPQVEVILWREIQRARQRGNLPGRITSGTIPKWKTSTGEIIAYGRKPADLKSEADASQAFQGVHARYILIILDEACGIPNWLWDAVETLATNRFARVLAIGNPDVPETPFAKTHSPESSWNKLKISAFDTPAYTKEQVPQSLLDDLVSPNWVKQRAEEWGKESPLYISKVDAEFPEVSEETLIHPRWIQQAQLQDFSSAALHESGRFGLDVARFGRNETVCYRVRAGHLRREFAYVGKPTTHTTGQAVRLLNKSYGLAPMVIDTIGVGSGVFDQLKEQGFSVVPFVASEAPSGPVNKKRFANRRAEQWWSFRKQFERGLIDLPATNEDSKLIAQLGAIRYFIRSDGRIIVESKDDMEARGMPSPDRADAAMMACADPLPAAGEFYVPQLPEQRALQLQTNYATDIQAFAQTPDGLPTSVDLASLTADLLTRDW
jgi:hypothetical protein